MHGTALIQCDVYASMSTRLERFDGTLRTEYSEFVFSWYSGVRYRIFSYHDYCTQHITIRYISRYTTHHSACVFTLRTLVVLMY